MCLSRRLPYLPICFHQFKVFGRWARWESLQQILIAPIIPPLRCFSLNQNLLTAADSSRAASGILIISTSWVFYSPPAPFTGSAGANEGVFLIEMRQGEHKVSSPRPHTRRLCMDTTCMLQHVPDNDDVMNDVILLPFLFVVCIFCIFAFANFQLAAIAQYVYMQIQ